MHKLLVSIFLVVGCAHTAPPLAPRSDDVATIDGVMRAFYDVVNVGPNEPRQWARDRTLYAPWIHFVAHGERRQVYDHPAFVADTEPLLQAGFHEREIHRTVRQYGNVAHVESTYETRSGPEQKRSRGVNFLELSYDGARWWVVSAVWQSETPALPIAPQFLPSSALE